GFLVVGLGAALGDALSRLNLETWRRTAIAWSAGVGIAWMAVAAATVWPHGLCYVNEAWGGASHAYERVSGSDYDWGQGVRELARWREANAQRVSLLYYGTDPVARSDHFAYLFADLLPASDDDATRAALGERDLAVSVSLLYGPRLKHDRL